MIFIPFILSLIYALVMLQNANIWKNLPFDQTKILDKINPVSIIISARNEELNIEKCIEALSLQNYPKHQIELIVINDHSTDNTFKITEKLFIQYDFQNGIVVQAKNSGKKSAIQQGVELAKSKIILTTDADCLPLPNWVSLMTSKLIKDKKNLICGSIQIMQKRNFLNQFQTFEQSGLICIGAASIYKNKPNMANGASMCYYKHIFLEVNPYSDNLKIPSGDDEYFLAKIHAYYPKSIGFLKSKNASVFTASEKSFSALINQRTRWASKAKHYKNKNAFLSQIFLFTYFISIWALIISGFMNTSFLPPVLALISFKILIEFIFYYQLKNYFNLRNILINLIKFQIVHLTYLPLVALKSIFGHYQWKNRQY